MSDDITLERFTKKGGRTAYQIGADIYLTVKPKNRAGAAYQGTLSAQARRELGEPEAVNVYTADDPPILAFEAATDPDGDSYSVQDSGLVSLTAILKRGFGLTPEGKWHIEGEYDADRDLLLFDLSDLSEADADD